MGGPARDEDPATAPRGGAGGPRRTLYRMLGRVPDAREPPDGSAPGRQPVTGVPAAARVPDLARRRQRDRRSSAPTRAATRGVALGGRRPGRGALALLVLHSTAGMQRPLEMTFRHMAPSPAIEAVVRREVAKLERFHPGLVGCTVAIERPQRFQRQGNLFRVRIQVSAGTRRPVVVTRDPLDTEMHEDLRRIVTGAFRAVRRQLQADLRVPRGEARPPQEPRALVVRLFPDADYGFLKTPDGRELYFHRNSVLHGDFERLAVGTEVRFEETEGDEGPQASTVQIVNKPGVRLPASAPPALAPPRGWGGAGPRQGAPRRKRRSRR